MRKTKNKTLLPPRGRALLDSGRRRDLGREKVGQLLELGPFATRRRVEETEADRILVGKDKKLIASLEADLVTNGLGNHDLAFDTQARRADGTTLRFRRSLFPAGKLTIPGPDRLVVQDCRHSQHILCRPQ